MTAPTGEALVPMYECRSKAERAREETDMTIRLLKGSTLIAAAIWACGVCQAQPNYSVVVPKPPHGIPIKNASMARPTGQSSSTDNGILYA